MGKSKLTKPTILIVDDEKNIRDSMEELLKDDYSLLFAKSGKEVIQIVKKESIDLVLLDIRLPEINGMEVLKMIKGLDESIEVIMITAVSTVASAVAAIKHGAYDYITKPFDIQAITEQVKKCLEKKALQRENVSLRKIIESEYQFEKIVGKSEEIREVFKVIKEVAGSPASVLISGESGTGKELVARAIHARSPRKDKLFVAVNCAAIPENLLESELFGHERGSFTGAYERQIGKFEIAQGGTLFLDEISAMPLPMQAKLLRAIQEKEIERIGGSHPLPVDVRIISATNLDLRTHIKNYKFREDLYYRLNVIPIHLPPLRERREDISLLAEHFLHKHCQALNKKLKGFKPEVIDLLIAYDWPGNVRELENLIERLVVLTKEGSWLGKDRLPLEIKAAEAAFPAKEDADFKKARLKFEAEFIRQALEKTQGHKQKAAKLLGIHRNTLLQIERKLKQQRIN